MKKIISSIIAISLLANVATVGAFANEGLQKSTPANSYVKNVDKADSEQDDEPISEKNDIIYGDLNGDKKVNLQDVVELQKYIAELVKLSEDALKASDVNLDSKLNLEDVTTMQRYIAELIPQLPYNNGSSSTTDTEDTSSDAENTDTEDTLSDKVNTDTEDTSSDTEITDTENTDTEDTSDDEVDYKLNSTRRLLRTLIETIQSEINDEIGYYYTEESYKSFKEYYDKVKDYCDSYDKDEYKDYDINQLLSLYAQLKLLYDDLELTKLGELRRLLDEIYVSQVLNNPYCEYISLPMYTEEAIKNLSTRWNKAMSDYGAFQDGNYDEDKVNKVIEDLEDAYYNMEYTPPAELSMMLSDLANETEWGHKYTDDSFKVFSDTYKKAMDLISDDSRIVPREEYDAMWEELSEAYYDLEPSAKGRISDIYGMFIYGEDDFCHSFYTEESLAVLEKLCLFYKDNMNKLTDEQLEELADSMEEAYYSLEPSTFSTAFDMVDYGRYTLDEQDYYTIESLAAFKTAYYALYDFIVNPGKYSDEEVEILISDLDECLGNLEETPFGLIDTYSSYLLAFKDLNEEEIDMYTKDYIEKVNTLTEKIEAYLDDPSSVSKEDEKKLADALVELIDNEEYSPYGNLYNVLSYVEGYILDESESSIYTEESYKKLCDLFEEASGMISDYKNYTDEQLTEMEEKLLEAVDNLEVTPIGNLMQLCFAGNMLIGMNAIEPICVEESMEKLIEVLEEAEEYLNGESEITDEKTSEFVEKIEAAINEVEFTMEYALAIAQEFIDSVEEHYEIMKESDSTEWVEAFDKLKALLEDPENTTSREIIELVDILYNLTQESGILENLTDYTPDKAIVELNKLDL
ncbi:MAG: dockerin type I repeat-containing protein [Clostridia bacterium]|nr:dockerin type I repeat-containing protein [Clostridia bacterium]